MFIDFAHEEDAVLKITDKAVIPVETGIQKVLKSQFLWTLAFAGVTNQLNQCFSATLI
jgi:hypothetical protein